MLPRLVSVTEAGFEHMILLPKTQLGIQVRTAMPGFIYFSEVFILVT
jgi:hypothetical protein